MSLIDGLIERAKRYPYYPLVNRAGETYMNRGWLFGDGTDRDRDDRLPDAPYMNKARGRFAHWLARHVCLRIHEVTLSDSDRHLHDHPAWNISVILRGGYYEVKPDRAGSKYPFHDLLKDPERHGIREKDFYVGEPSVAVWRPQGTLIYRFARSRHKLVLPIGQTTWTLFAIGKKTNEWGFYRAGVKIGWRDYDSDHHPTKKIA